MVLNGQAGWVCRDKAAGCSTLLITCSEMVPLLACKMGGRREKKGKWLQREEISGEMGRTRHLKPLPSSP